MSLRATKFYINTYYKMLRYFKIMSLEDGENFAMYSKFDSEFGESILSTIAPLYVSKPDGVSIVQSVVAGAFEDIPFDVRISEMRYFLDCFSMFNPINQVQYEKKTQQSAPSPDFPL